MSKQITILIIFLSLFSGLIIGSFFSYSFLSKSASKEINYWKGLAEQCYPPLPEMAVEQNGEVIEIENLTISIKYQEKISRFPLPGGKEFEERILKARLSLDTEIKKLEIVQDVQGNYVAQTSLARFEDIKLGDEVTIISDENIKGKTEVFVHTIVILAE